MNSDATPQPALEPTKKDYSKWYAISGTVFTLGVLYLFLSKSVLEFMTLIFVLLLGVLIFNVIAIIKKSLRWLAILNLLLSLVLVLYAAWIVLRCLTVGCL